MRCVWCGGLWEHETGCCVLQGKWGWDDGLGAGVSGLIPSGSDEPGYEPPTDDEREELDRLGSSNA